MAEIPVERRKGFPWWLPLLALVGLLLIGFVLMRGCNDRTAAVTDNTNNNRNANAALGTDNTNNANARMTTQGVGTATGERVTDVNLFGSTAEKSTLAGRRVDLQNVKVNRVVSDRVFTLTSGSGEMFVMLDDTLNRGGMEEQIKMQPGQLVNLGGTFQGVPTEEIKDEQRRDLNAGEYARMKGQQIYLHATDVKNAK
ncbi:MAG TPA: hypothetical protein VM866_00560 [Pyrinomonadaceae bacterium]|jgi:hypothetical protein|nr:hypothetical protein [Pyrinomonadaceae bacterium]